MFQTKACSLVSSRLCGANLLFLSLLYFEWKAAHIQNSIARIVLRVPQRTCFTEQIKWSSAVLKKSHLNCPVWPKSNQQQLSYLSLCTINYLHSSPLSKIIKCGPIS